MSYLDMVNHFWRIDQTAHFSGNQTRLYFCLLNLFNRALWPADIICGDRLLAAHVGVSLNALKRARDNLSRHEFISFHPGGKGHGDKTRYQLLTPTRTPSPSNYKTKDFTDEKLRNKSNKGFVATNGDFD